MAKNEPFAEKTQETPFVKAVNRLLRRNNYRADFWESREDQFISRASLFQGADIIAVTMTREEWRILLDEMEL